MNITQEARERQREGARRGHQTRLAQQRERYAAAKAEAEEMLSLGFTPEQIAADFGVKRDSLNRRFHRGGDHELARKF